MAAVWPCRGLLNSCLSAIICGPSAPAFQSKALLIVCTMPLKDGESHCSRGSRSTLLWRYCLIFCIELGCNDLTIMVFHLYIFAIKSQGYWALIAASVGSPSETPVLPFGSWLQGSAGAPCVWPSFFMLIKNAVMYSVPSESASHSYQPLHLVLTNEVC